MASPRREITDALERLAFACELLDDKRAQTYGRAAWAMRNLGGDVAQMRQSGELAEVRHIGPAVLAVVDAVLASERPAKLVEYEAKVPAGLFAVRQIKGLGPKKVKALWKQLSIASIGELEYACNENRLVDLSGFGEKTQTKVLAQIAKMRSTEGLRRRDRAQAELRAVIDALEALDEAVAVAMAGELPRGLELIAELAVVVAAEDPEGSRATLEAALGAAKAPETAVSLHVARPGAFGAALVWHTSSEGHRRRLQEHALTRGLTLRAGGLFDGESPGAALVETPNEQQLYSALGLLETARERREDDTPLCARGSVNRPLVTRADLRGALHNHTVASDGSATLDDMRAAAAARGLEYLGISEHSVSAFYARGLDEERLQAQRARIAALEDGACTVLTGVESDILEHGALDYPPELLAQLDVVVASVHRRHAQDREAMTQRMLAAIEHPCADIVGHPTGRLLLGRDASPVDMPALLEACVRRGVAMELNANPARLDLSVEHLGMAREAGVAVSISADAHSTGELDHLEHGVAVARRAGLGPEDVLNARSLSELRVWVSERRRASGVSDA